MIGVPPGVGGGCDTFCDTFDSGTIQPAPLDQSSQTPFLTNEINAFRIRNETKGTLLKPRNPEKVVWPGCERR